MAFGRRKEIANFLVEKFNLINGTFSNFDSNYKYKSNIVNKVFRRIKFLDEINSFPSAYIQIAEETRLYNTDEFVEAELPVVIRVYVKSGSPTVDLENIAQDIEHVIYSLPNELDIGITDITIDDITNDNGVIAPFGIGEVFLTVFYQLER